jgi:hypothetical protein
MANKKSTTAPRLLPFDEADAALNGALSDCFQCDYETVLFCDGGLTVEGDFLPGISRITSHDPGIVAVKGDLTVHGRIALYDFNPGLFVGGFTRAETLEGGNCEIYIQDGAFTFLVHGYDNDGILKAGELEVPWLVNYMHDLCVRAPNTLFIDNYAQNDNADFDRIRLGKVFAPEVIDANYNRINVDLFLERLQAGLPVLLPGAKSARKTAP